MIIEFADFKLVNFEINFTGYAVFMYVSGASVNRTLNKNFGLKLFCATMVLL